jgi:probable rRNA maturation factor
MGKRNRSIHVAIRILPTLPDKPSRTLVRKAAIVAFESAGVGGPATLSVVITDDAQIRVMNRKYRKIDAVTDVLSFGNAAEGFVLPAESDPYFGDVVISLVRAAEQAAVFGHPVAEELSLLVIHGVLHLLGFDHEQESDKEEMWRLQEAALVRLEVYWQP